MSQSNIDMRNGLRQLTLELREKEPILLEYIKAVSNSVRLSILVSLIEKEKDFSDLQSETNVAKTILSNHLHILLSNQLVNKLSHGTYRLTDTGLLLIESLEDFISRSSRRGQDSPAAYLMSRPKVEMVTMKSNKVKNIPDFPDSWITLLSAATGILRSFGLDIDTVDVFGYSGHAFVACMTKGITSAAPPTAHPFFEEVHEGIESLGFKFKGDYDPGAIFPTKDIKLKDQKRLIKLFESIKEQIDRNNPVILWGPVTAEFAIVYGYDGDNYLVKTFRSWKGQEETPIHYQNLNSPGGLWYYYFQERTHQMTEKHDLEAIQRVMTIMTGRAQAPAVVGTIEFNENYDHLDEWGEIEVEFISGSESFSVWKENLQHGKLDRMGNSLVAATYQEGYQNGSAFLKRIATKYPDQSFKDDLLAASALFGEMADKLNDFCQIFPFPDKKEHDEGDLEQGASIMGKCETLYREALGKLKAIAEKWEKK